MAKLDLQQTSFRIEPPEHFEGPQGELYQFYKATYQCEEQKMNCTGALYQNLEDSSKFVWMPDIYVIAIQNVAINVVP